MAVLLILPGWEEEQEGGRGACPPARLLLVLLLGWGGEKEMVVAVLPFVGVGFEMGGERTASSHHCWLKGKQQSYYYCCQKWGRGMDRWSSVLLPLWALEKSREKILLQPTVQQVCWLRKVA